MSRAEVRWLLVASLAVLLFASLPTLYAWSLADADHVFTGFVYNVEDGNSYLAKMRLGARGEWFFHLFYTSEPHDPALAFPLHILLGKLAAATGLSLALTYHLARVVLGLVLLWTVYAFVAEFTPDVTVRRLAWAVVAVGSGLGWLWLLLGRSEWLGAMPLDFWVPEAYVFLVLYNLPHLALAEALLLATFLYAHRALAGRGFRSSLAAGLALCIAAWIVPFYAGIPAAVLGAWLVLLAIRRRRIPWREIGLAAVIGLLALPPVVYNAWVFTTNPAFRLWAAQNQILSPHPLHYLAGYALLLVPAIAGAIQLVRQQDERWGLPILWVLVVPCLLYLPFNLQRRMVSVVQVPLALLAAIGLERWLARVSGRGRRWLRAAYVGVLSLSNILLVIGSLGWVQQRSEPIYRPGAEIAALTWLGAHSQADETALSSPEVGNVIPAWTDLRAFIGHGPETLHHAAKREMVRRFFDPATDDAWRQQMLREYDITYVFYSLAERNLGTWDPTNATYLELIFEEGEYCVLRRMPY